MANWYGSARSNYFRVKDRDAFLKWADGRGLGVFRNEESRDLFAIYGGESTGDGSWPSYDVEGDTEIDLVSPHFLQRIVKSQFRVCGRLNTSASIGEQKAKLQCGFLRS
jgi:hypothetical protein